MAACCTYHQPTYPWTKNTEEFSGKSSEGWTNRQKKTRQTKKSDRKIYLVSWYFELSQPWRITSWRKTTFNLSPIYSACKSSNYKSSKNHKISPDTNPHKTKNVQTSNTNFWRISPFGIAPFKKAHKAHQYHGLFLRFINTRFKKSIKKEWTETIKNVKYYINP